ncbi:cytochrome b/b6 domain-containing protein [Microbacterium sp. 4R-513]|nr:cytochrome b/b6 domain-containing protein [Microbacterium sp. 4R-513]QIG41162.1 cytochrome b/b6 domain-containing protein [Microbacterium sp. 4R-513]
MATTGTARGVTTLRRGLPRVPGGEPWPPPAELSAAPASPGATTPAAELVEASNTSPSPLTPAEPAAPAGSAIDASTSSGTGEGVAAPAVGAGDGSLRRGLPRVPGGEPWPASSAVRVARTAEAPATSGAPAFDPSTSSGTGQEIEGEVAEVRHVRRGLPRPAASAAAAAATAAPAPPAAAAATPAIATPEAPAAPAAVAAAPPVAAASTPAAVAAPAAAATTVAVPAAEASVVAAARAPLPFTRTVWPGSAAVSRPVPRPEPKRYGPFTRAQWAGAVVVGGAGLLFAAAMVILATRWFLSLEFMQEFLAAYPGEYPLPEGAPVGIPPWLGWQHFFNTFLIVLIIRSGLQVRTEKRPSVFWSPRNNNRRKISLNLWFHQSLDILWIVNGVLFVVLLFVTGQWMKIVPTSWAVFPNALSALLQYVSLDWPTENGWVNYNSLQQLAYFATVFLAAPLAILTGVRMSGVWPKNAQRLSKAYPIEWARAVHFPVMIYFVLFIIVHVTLVFATAALRNLNHMYASQDAVNWVGFWIFVASLVVIAAGWVAARPLVLAPIARLFGKVSGR